MLSLYVYPSQMYIYMMCTYICTIYIASKNAYHRKKTEKWARNARVVLTAVALVHPLYSFIDICADSVLYFCFKMSLLQFCPPLLYELKMGLLFHWKSANSPEYLSYVLFLGRFDRYPDSQALTLMLGCARETGRTIPVGFSWVSHTDTHFLTLWPSQEAPCSTNRTYGFLCEFFDYFDYV